MWGEDDDDCDDFDYSDDEEDMGQEVIRKVDSLDEGYAVLSEFVSANSGHSYGLLSLNNDELLVTTKTDKPCYGELRPYKKFVNPLQKDTRGMDTKPSDLPHGFPDGEILALAVAKYDNWFTYPDANYKKIDAFLRSSESPYRKVWALPGFEYVTQDDVMKGYIWKETDFHPTPVIQALMALRHIQNSANVFSKLPDSIPEQSRIWLSLVGMVMEWGPHTNKYQFMNIDPYTFNWQASNLSRFFSGQPYDLDGLTFRHRAAYNRPNIHFTFGCKRKYESNIVNFVSDDYDKVQENLSYLMSREDDDRDWSNGTGLEPYKSATSQIAQ